MNERLTTMGRLSEAERDAKTIRLRAEGLIQSVRAMLDPYEALENLKLDVAALQVSELVLLRRELVEANELIRAMKLDLGIR